MPGAAEALAAFGESLIQCVATNATESSGEDVAEALARVGLRKYLSHFLTSGELGASKPDPEFFRAVAHHLGFPPSALVSVGNDYRRDIEPAKAVGMATVLVSTGADPQGHPAADLLVGDLGRLAALAGGGGGGA
jgi:putative hydrolase of the HAD superfamily